MTLGRHRHCFVFDIHFYVAGDFRQYQFQGHGSFKGIQYTYRGGNDVANVKCYFLQSQTVTY